MKIGNNLVRLDSINNKMKDEDSFLIKSFCNSIKDHSGMNDAIHILNDYKNKSDKFVYNPNTGSYRFNNYYIIPGMKIKDTAFEKNLKLINRLGHCKTSAPDLIMLANSKDNQFNVIVYKLNGTEGGILEPLVSLKNVPQSSKKRFVDEQLALLSDTGLYNEAITDSYDYWYLTPDTKNIFIDSWSSLKKCINPDEKQIVSEKLKSRV